MQPRFKPTAYFRQSVGIDIAKATFTACLSMLDAEGCNTPSIEFTNDRRGFNQLDGLVKNPLRNTRCVL